MARATLYFLVRYPGHVNDSMSEMTRDRLDTLLAWHKAQKPGRYEKHRNAASQKAQGNRNPFIDFPALAEHIDFAKGFG